MTNQFESEKEKIDNDFVEKDILSSTKVSSSKKSPLIRYKVGYGLTQLALGAPFSAFNTYINFQLQIVGYTIGAEPGNALGTGCSLLATSCNVPFGKSDQIDYVSFVNYINAICYASTGVIILTMAGLADRIGYKREQYLLFLIIYGAFALPSAALKESDQNTFSTLAALYIVFNIVGFVAGNWGKYFIPFLMFHGEDEVEHQQQQQETTDEKFEQTRSDTIINSNVRQGRENKGITASVWGNNALSIGQMMVLIITIGITYASASFAGLYVSTASGVLCMLLSLIAWRLLPEAKTVKPIRSSWYMEPIYSVRDLLFGLRQYPQAFKLLMACTIYADSILVFGTVIASLFTLNVSRDQRIYSAYSIVQPASALFAGIIAAFMFPRFSIKQDSLFTLKRIMVICLAINAFVMVWCCIGISNSIKIGFKHGWEFYLWQAVQGFANAMINFTFQVLFCQLIPRGQELEYFGFQTILSCATIWIPQIVNGPIVTATNIVRLPAIVSLITLIISIALLIWCDDIKGIKTTEEEAIQFR